MKSTSISALRLQFLFFYPVIITLRAQTDLAKYMLWTITTKEHKRLLVAYTRTAVMKEIEYLQ